MGGSLSEGLRIILAIVLTCLVGALAFVIWGSVKESGNTAIRDTNNLANEMNESKFTDYEATEITGSEVVNLIKRFHNEDIYVGVNVGSGMVNYIHSDASLSAEGADLIDAKDKTSGQYINPNSMFVGHVVRADVTDAIVGIEFTKQ